MRNLNQKHFLLIFSLLIITSSCQDSNNNKILDSSYLHNANVALEQDIVHDFFSPPVTSRIYLYPNLLAYEIMSSKDSNYASLNSVFPNFPNFPKFKSDQGQEIAALYGFLKVARELVYTTNHIDKEIKKI
jgi:hypothetical protein